MDIIENINMWYAKDENNNIITIDEINKSNKNKFYCPICDSEVIPNLGNIRIHHFKHIDKSKCTNESMIHFWVKNELIKIGDGFNVYFNNKEDIIEYKCKDIFIEKEYNTNFGKYRPDVTILTEDDKTIFFEIANTNKKKVKYNLDKWIELNNMVIEVDVKDIVNRINNYKVLYYNGKVFKKFNNNKTNGQYKIHILENSNIEQAKLRIKKLDWFVKSFNKHRKMEMEDEDLMEVIDSLDTEDRIYVIDGLIKTNCSKFRNLYMYDRQNKIVSIVKKFFKERDMYDFEIQKCETSVYRDLFKKNFRIPYVKVLYNGENILNLYSDNFDYDKTIAYLNNCRLINNEEYIGNIKNKISDLYNGYSVSILDNGSCNYFKLYIHYDNNVVINKTIYCDNFNNMLDCIIKEINILRKNINFCLFEKEIYKYVDDISKRIKNKVKKIGHYKPQLYKRFISENVLDISINIISDKKMCKIYGNSIYLYDRCKIEYFSNICEFKKIFEKLITDAIRKERYIK